MPGAARKKIPLQHLMTFRSVFTIISLISVHCTRTMCHHFVTWTCNNIHTNSMHQPTNRARCTVSWVSSVGGRSSLSEPITDRPRFLFPPGALYTKTYEQKAQRQLGYVVEHLTDNARDILNLPLSTCWERRTARGQWGPSVWAQWPAPQTGPRTAECLTAALSLCASHCKCCLPGKTRCATEETCVLTWVETQLATF